MNALHVVGHWLSMSAGGTDVLHEQYILYAPNVASSYAHSLALFNATYCGNTQQDVLKSCDMTEL